MAELTSMVNIGREMARKLESIGIASPEALARLGAKQAFVRLKEAYPQVCLVHLYTLAGAIDGTPLGDLPAERKRELKAFSDCLKSRGPGDAQAAP